MRCYGFGEGLMARATQPRQPSKDEQIAALRAENERLRKELNEFVSRWSKGKPPTGRELDIYLDAARAALGKGAA